MSRAFAVCLLIVASVLLTMQTQSISAQGRARGPGRAAPGGQGRKPVHHEMPAEMGARNGADAIDALRGELGQKVRERGHDPAQYAAMMAADASLWIDNQGQLMFVDAIDHDVTEGPDDLPDDETPAPTGPPPQPIQVLSNGMPIHHSNIGARWTIYLDFDGEIVRNTFWGLPTRQTRGLTIDADANTFNVEEQAVISRIWGRVAEDWAPFDVDITTERPAIIGGTVLWSIIGEKPQDFGFDSRVGGVSLFCFCYMPFGLQTPTFTFWKPWGPTDHSTIADVITQENGHMFGLLHDGIINPLCFGGFCEYYEGHGTGPTSWGPVMGAPNRRNVTQWSRGEYANATNGSHDFTAPVDYPLQDDIAIIAGKLGFRADDFGDTPATALPLSVPATGYITQTSDVDVFALPHANDVRITVMPFRAGELEDGGNLDVAVEIVNSDGVVVASADDPEETVATLNTILPPGQHYVRVRPSFSANYPIYDSLGQYTITGTFTNIVRLTGFDAPLPTDVMTPGRTIPVKFDMTDGVASARVQLWSSDAGASTVLAETICNAQAEFRQHCNLKLPKDLASGATYWIVAQFEDLDGHWVTAPIVPGSTVSNPLSFVAR